MICYWCRNLECATLYSAAWHACMRIRRDARGSGRQSSAAISFQWRLRNQRRCE